MPRLRKFIFNNHVHFITCGVEEGIMFPANPLVTFITKSALLRAQKHHPIKISHFLVNGTHIHMIVRAENPEDIPGFMERFKTESAHYLNRIIGRRKRTIWCKGYDSPRLNRISGAIKYIAYTYINPVKDGLIESINNYPGLSSWNIYQKRQKRLFGRIINRDDIIKIDQEATSKNFHKAVRLFTKISNKQEEIIIDPNDWMRAFNIETQEEIDEINKEILKKINALEIEIRKERARNNKPFLGRNILENQAINLSYQPKRGGRKMWCICSDRKERKKYISVLKGLAKEARETYKEWKRGNTSLRMPEGVFAPCMPFVANRI